MCSLKFSDFSSLISSRPVFKNTISGFHKTNKNTPNTIKWYIGMFVLMRAISWCTLFTVTSVITCGKQYSSVFTEQPTSSYEEILKTLFWNFMKKPWRNIRTLMYYILNVLMKIVWYFHVNFSMTLWKIVEKIWNYFKKLVEKYREILE